MFATMVLAAGLTGAPCWDVFDAALRHRAAVEHPRYVTYDERTSISEDEQPVVQSGAHVEYRDDGLARVSDDRFDYTPYLTRHQDPGPPELGPYGSDRLTWLPLPQQPQALRVIGWVRTHGGETCEIAGRERYKDHDTYHLVFHGAPTDRPALKAVWIDVQSADIWKVIVSGYLYFFDRTPAPLADFAVELRYAGPYLVVDHVTWSYRERLYDQYAQFFGEYEFTGFRFPNSLPDAYFALGRAPK